MAKLKNLLTIYENNLSEPEKPYASLPENNIFHWTSLESIGNS